ncbi:MULTISPECIES: 3-phosphoserine/phosphohydroxythreonine transaminase [unclassified Pedobacter]|uniref:3-phosphoserine/phosphohydroxythreonine transaminase n=1 Tax=unclassified Pedobacter TaxID=2628915 RepID=UPI001DB5D12A|nr:MULTISPECIES: 3-phosphoserine/phosphohydroxythreonine transaminase [unclassified Pedobacter]CAH0146902.1 Phosphoserine aminotransferase [Pedobacter sp. Bi126]CAH0211400.1 Phosphoserine aminotransferase [Pedobacter sp. Bi36]
MHKKHNFGAGPCILPSSVMEQAAQAVINWGGMGLSILEVSHRSSEFEDVVLKTQLLVRELLSVPDQYSVLFLQGGASTQFAMVPMNFLSEGKKAAYLDTGYFAQKAIKEANLFGEVEIVASSKDKDYAYIPAEFNNDKQAAYLHCTSNNTIEGTEIFDFPTAGVPFICDMSSDIFSRKINITDFDLIYAGAQKNMGPAGMTLVIAKNEFLNQAKKEIPSMLDYRVFRDNMSMYNTPPVFSIYVAMLNLLWLKDQGGVSGIEQRNIEKAKLLYAEIDRNPLFYGTADVEHRSRMNVTFLAINKEVETGFLKFAADQGIVGIKGYRTVGGFRASLYNALPLSSVEVLVNAMVSFEKIYSDKTVLELE